MPIGCSGTIDDSDDAVQEAWLRLSRTDSAAIENLGGWLTTVVGRVCLDMLRARRSRREDYVGSWLPEPVVTVEDQSDPEQEALLADSVGLALLVVLETLTPAERLAFVLHDMFGLPFEEIAPIVERTPAATRQLASRGRRRVRGAQPETDADLSEQREVVDAFLAAARDGDFEGLIAVLDPDVVFRIDLARTAGRRGLTSKAPRRSPARSWRAARRLHRSRAPRSSTALRVRSSASAGGRSPSPASLCRTAASPRSTSSPTPPNSLVWSSIDLD